MLLRCLGRLWRGRELCGLREVRRPFALAVRRTALRLARSGLAGERFLSFLLWRGEGERLLLARAAGDGERRPDRLAAGAGARLSR